MSRKRITIMAIFLGVVVLTAVISWIAGSSIQSPADAAARTAPPTPSPILVPVEERVISTDIIARGTARFGLPQPVSLAPSTLKPNPGVITTLPLPNTQLAEGDVLLIASGRPVFVLQGAIPAYRDLTPGLTGKDVRQLEEGLARLGFDPGPVDGVYDEQTAVAVGNWYKAAGFEPFGPTPSQLAQIRALEKELALAQEESANAADAAAASPLAVDAAKAAADNANQRAAADLALAQAKRDKVLADPSASSQDRAQVEAEYAAAQKAVQSTRLSGEVSVQAAIDAQHAAERKATRLQAVADQAAAVLKATQGKVGVYLPIDEVVFMSTTPVRVEAVKVGVGDPAQGLVMTVTDNQLAIDSALPLDQSPLVKPGMPVAIDEPDLGIKTTGTVKQVDPSPGTHGVDGYHVYMEIQVDKTQAPLAGTSLRLTIPVESTGGKVTAVPINALSMAADGTSRVQVDTNGMLSYVDVTPGLAAAGYVQVTPVNGSLTPGQMVVVGYQNQ